MTYGSTENDYWKTVIEDNVNIIQKPVQDLNCASDLCVVKRNYKMNIIDFKSIVSKLNVGIASVKNLSSMGAEAE